ncbi:MAG: hypothetical protein AAF320_03725 [Myxococcota bacterium]
MRRTGFLKDVVQFVRMPWDWGQLDVFHQLEPLHLKLEKLKRLERRKRLQRLKQKHGKSVHH